MPIDSNNITQTALLAIHTIHHSSSCCRPYLLCTPRMIANNFPIKSPGNVASRLSVISPA